MIRWLASAAVLGTLTGLALTFGPHAAIAVAVCALAVVVLYLVRSIEGDRREWMRRGREEAWQRRARAEAIERGKPKREACTYPWCSYQPHDCPRFGAVR